MCYSMTVHLCSPSRSPSLCPRPIPSLMMSPFPPLLLLRVPTSLLSLPQRLLVIILLMMIFKSILVSSSSVSVILLKLSLLLYLHCFVENETKRNTHTHTTLEKTINQIGIFGEMRSKHQKKGTKSIQSKEIIGMRNGYQSLRIRQIFLDKSIFLRKFRRHNCLCDWS